MLRSLGLRRALRSKLRMTIPIDGWIWVQQHTFCPASLAVWQERNMVKIIRSREDQAHELGLFSPSTSSAEDPQHVHFLNVALYPLTWQTVWLKASGRHVGWFKHVSFDSPGRNTMAHTYHSAILKGHVSTRPTIDLDKIE